ncbi:hypothetical protein CRG98_027424, partial [Punica granatum]
MGVTRSGRVYTNPEIAGKGKAPVASGAALEAPPIPQKKVTEEEAESFMKVIKASEYKVVEQMGKSPTHISLLALLLSSEPHREALLRVLTAAQVPKETAPDRIEETVSSIFSDAISFSNDELPSEGWAISRALHIICKWNNFVIGRVMIDNGSALNVCPVSTLKQMNVDLNRVRSSKTAVRAFDGSRREVNWEIDLLIDVGPCSFSVTFQVLDIPNAFSLLLGRPWIHSAGAVPSSLHQWIKFITEGRLFTVKGEEDYAIYKETVVPYISIGDDENLPFHSFETISVIRDYGDVRPSRADRMGGKVLLRQNYVPGTELGAQGQGINCPIEIKKYKNRRGLGFRPSCHKIIEARRGMHLHHLAAHYGKINRGLDPSIVKHFLLLDTERFPPKRQHLRRQRANLLLCIKEEVIKQINAGFLEVCNYSEWVANIVPMKKKDGKVRVCVDYRDLNKASPKDNFPLPHIDVLVDNTARHTLFSFMDGFSGYNQIRMDDEDKIKSTFITMWGTFCYRVMPFGLKNAGATYQRAMNISKWRCQLMEYDIEYVPRTSVKEQAIADHLAEFPIEDDTPINSDFPDEGILQVDSEENKFAWRMYFDGAINSTGSGIGAVLISPDGRYYPVAAKVDFPCTNNVAEYEACIIGLQAAIDFKVKELEVFGDSMLTIFQTLGQRKTNDAKLVPYHEYLAENFKKISFTYTLRIKNQFADALARLASMVSITKENLIEPLEIKIAKGPAHCDAIEATDEQPWYEDIKHFLQTGQYPTFTNRRDKKTLRRLVAHYFMSGE